ncbi:hypothetical protein ACHAXA_008754 [Cyclostephanos tholiformis]|uniref:Uncharacterized protein n=1 Tax=Cyclostephanos tholiformis TaxID=382380 RepID=A0ABD3RD87_9STRA
MTLSEYSDVSIPPIIHSGKCSEYSVDISLDGPQLAIDAIAIQKSQQTTSIMKDESTAGERFSSGYDDEDTDTSSDDETASVQSDHTIDSTRRLLRKASQRLRHQSMVEENKILQAELSHYKNSVESTLRQKLDLKNKCDTLESQLAQAMDTIQHNKVQAQRWSEERAQRERDFMNQLNELCSEMKRNEYVMMGEIIDRDKKISEMQNRLNEVEGRSGAAREGGVVAHVEIDMDDESWNDDSSCEFI